MAQPTHFFDKLRALVEQQNAQQPQQVQQAPQQAAPSLFSPPPPAMPNLTAALPEAVVEQPPAPLIEAQGYSPAPIMPGYAMERTGSPFMAPQQQQAPLATPQQVPSLWDALGQPQQQPYSLWKGY